MYGFYSYARTNILFSIFLLSLDFYLVFKDGCGDNPCNYLFKEINLLKHRSRIVPVYIKQASLIFFVFC